MHTFSDSTTGVPAFLAKLWRLVEDADTNNLIYWQSDGRSFVIQNQAQFARELLPQNYKHNNMASFIRQLNMYGFHKIASIDNGGLKFDRDEMEFSHPCFQRDNPYLLEHIKRKIATTKQTPDEKTALKPETVNKVMNEVKVVRGRQDTLDSRFSAMKQENEALWREIAVLRQKHMKQQQIVNKLIQFLVTLVQPTRGTGGINTMNGVKRRFQLMINDVPESSKKRKQSQDSGPVIHELTEDLLDDCNYDYDTPIDSPNIVSPATFSGNDDVNAAEEFSSPANFSVEDNTTLVDHPDSDLDNQTEEANDNGVRYVVNKAPGNDEWVEVDTVAEPQQRIKQEPAQQIRISYVKPTTKSKAPIKSVIVDKPTGTSLLNTQQLTKKRPQLVLKMNKPIPNDGKVIQSIIGPGKVVLANKPTTSTAVTANVQNKATKKPAARTYTNKNDFVGSDMPSDLFEPQDDSGSQVFNNDINLASGSYNPSLSDDYTKKLTPTSSKNLAVAKYNNNKQDREDIQLNTPEDVNKQLDTIQTDLDSLKELFQADGDYSLDANALYGNSPGSSSTKNRLLLSPSVDSELLAKIFGDLDAPFGLSMNSDFPLDKRDDAGTSGSELMSYNPYNSIDLSEIMDPDSAIGGVAEHEHENAEEDSLLNAPELNTPSIDKKSISFTK